MTKRILYLGDALRVLNNFQERVVYEFPAAIKRWTEDNNGLIDFQVDHNQLRCEELHLLVRLLEIVPILQETEERVTVTYWGFQEPTEWISPVPKTT